MKYRIKNSFTDKKVYGSKEELLNAGYSLEWENKDGSFTVKQNDVLYVAKPVK